MVKINELKKARFFALRYRILNHRVLDFIVYSIVMTAFFIKMGIMINDYLAIYKKYGS